MDITVAMARKSGEPLTIEKAQLADLESDEVLVKMVASGVCHTDAVGRDAGMAGYPVVLGHEGSGIVQEVGSSVSTVEPGDHVVLSFNSCGVCESCLSGHPAECDKLNQINFGGRRKDGSAAITQDGEEVSNFFGQSSFSTYSVVSERGVVKVDEGADLKLLGPLGCGVQTGAGTVLQYFKPKFGDSIVIFGAGAVGLSGVMAARLMNMEHIIVVNRPNPYRLDMARELGATDVIESKPGVDVVAEIKRITGNGADFALETTGAAQCIKQSVNAIKPRGIDAVVGIAGDVTFNVNDDIMAESKTIAGVIEGDAIPQIFIPKIVKYYQKGLFPFDKLTRFYKFEDINQAFADSASGKVIKPIIVFD
ncbi:NAD(P)-dependent alcohol dehydrogenase [Levilactobacillus tujiorum]|uniref:NAD(P)-dependent alcohol dehydrogenase n=1 Tax=Levilactobacillus tujiorum TaxID=2912243 RepID=UPI0014571180|nr:NAD(P)-dependent alcohol dehydrogenase [Levilactobacillus tujiorum]NLR32210.1 NAD(P)-dependent alcohol dehydrogenase [Levilactobacillus tujiorum]